jgi:hypothetical protein
METEFLIEQGNQHRADRQYHEALKCYALAFVQDPESAAAWNNYGNVTREMGYPARSVPFLQHALVLEPNNVTAQFNLAVAYLLQGDYARGWPAYEARWNYEHLAGTEPQYQQPRWRGQDLQDKTILVVGEQGHGDNIQFVRFLWNLRQMGATVKLQVTDGLIPLLSRSSIIQQVGRYTDDMGHFDYWVPIMSIPGVLGITLDTMARPVSYLNADPALVQQWQERLGPKTRMRVGLCWSGRRDSWLNQHKAMPFDDVVGMLKANPQYEWINLQCDATDEETAELQQLGVKMFPGCVSSFAETAALIMHMDVVVSVDTAVAHLSGSLGRPLWLIIQRYSTDWRWLVDRDSSPWYSTARLFRQSNYGDWTPVIQKITQFLSWFKV